MQARIWSSYGWPIYSSEFGPLAIICLRLTPPDSGAIPELRNDSQRLVHDVQNQLLELQRLSSLGACIWNWRRSRDNDQNKLTLGESEFTHTANVKEYRAQNGDMRDSLHADSDTNINSLGMRIIGDVLLLQRKE